MLRLDRILVARDFSSCGERAVLPGLYGRERDTGRQALARGVPAAEFDGEQIRTAVRHGLSPGPVIARYAREHAIDLIVMGTPARRGWRRWVQGSLAATVIGQARARRSSEAASVEEGREVQERMVTPADGQAPILY